MTESPAVGNDDGTAGEDRLGASAQNTAHAFRAALSEPGRILSPVEVRSANALPVADPEPEPVVPETVPAPEPSRQPTAVLEDSDRKSEAQDAEPALDRPGAPVLAGAAIAGALLVTAPFAVVAGVPAVSLGTVAQQSPVTSALGDQTEGLSAQADSLPGQAGADGAPAADGGGGPPVTETAPDPGFVPEVQEADVNPALPDPGTVPEGTDAVVTSAPNDPGTGTEPPPGREGLPESTGVEGAAAEDGSAGEAGGPETAGDAAGDGSGAGDDGVPADEPGGSPVETGADGAESASGNGPATDPDGSGAAGDPAEDSTAGAGSSSEADSSGPGATDATDPIGGETFSAGGEAPQPPSPLDGADPREPSSVLDNAIERIVPVEDRYRALTGPGCAGGDDGSSYDSEGRWQSAEGSASWATRPGGYDQEGCEGSYDAIPVSGDPERGDHQSAAWTFAPGEEGAVCEIYVHVPDDESPVWVASGEARYLIHPGEDDTEAPVAVFGFDQSQVRGGWVQVTGFVSPSEQFTVRLTNAGEDPFPDQEHANAHVAASAMRADCS